MKRRRGPPQVVLGTLVVPPSSSSQTQGGSGRGGPRVDQPQLLGVDRGRQLLLGFELHFQVKGVIVGVGVGGVVDFVQALAIGAVPPSRARMAVGVSHHVVDPRFHLIQPPASPGCCFFFSVDPGAAGSSPPVAFGVLLPAEHLVHPGEEGAFLLHLHLVLEQGVREAHGSQGDESLLLGSRRAVGVELVLLHAARIQLVPLIPGVPGAPAPAPLLSPSPSASSLRGVVMVLKLVLLVVRLHELLTDRVHLGLGGGRGGRRVGVGLGVELLLLLLPSSPQTELGVP